MKEHEITNPFADRFRGFLPVVVDVETGGFDERRDALLQVAAVLLKQNDDGSIIRYKTVSYHIEPFPGANIEPESLKVNKIDPYHPLRIAVEENQALNDCFAVIRDAIKLNQCTRAILIGHNASFDLNFINAASARNKIKRNPFHPFSNFDTVSLAGMALKQTVLSRAVEAAGLAWNNEKAHSAVYDAEKTADLFCHIVNLWQDNVGLPE